MKTTMFFSCLITCVILQAQDTLTINIELAELTPTEKVYNFYFDDYDRIVGHQFALGYDTAGMSFRETRAYGTVHLGDQDFNEPSPGEIRSVSVNPTLQSEDLDNPFMAFQLVFDVITPGGSDLCLTTNPFQYLFIVMDGNQFGEYSHVRFYDDCHQPYVLGLQGTSTEDPVKSIPPQMSGVHLSADGLLTFSLASDHTAHIQLMDANGRLIADLKEQEMARGRQEFHMARSLVPGIYFVSFSARNGHRKTVKCVVAR